MTKPRQPLRRRSPHQSIVDVLMPSRDVVGVSFAIRLDPAIRNVDAVEVRHAGRARQHRDVVRPLLLGGRVLETTPASLLGRHVVHAGKRAWDPETR